MDESKKFLRVPFPWLDFILKEITSYIMLYHVKSLLSFKPFIWWYVAWNIVNEKPVISLTMDMRSRYGMTRNLLVVSTFQFGVILSKSFLYIPKLLSRVLHLKVKIHDILQLLALNYFFFSGRYRYFCHWLHGLLFSCRLNVLLL